MRDLQKVYLIVLHHILPHSWFKAFHAAGECRRHAAFNFAEIVTHKKSKLLNFMTIFGITVKNAVKKVQTCLVLVKFYVK